MKVAVIGGGLSGLSAALKLSEKCEVVVLEKENYLGGMASSYKVRWDGKEYSISKTYHHVLEGDETTKRFLSAFGVKLKKKKVKQGFVYRGKIHRFSSPIEVLAFPHPLIDKIKLGIFILLNSRLKRWEGLENVSAKEWIVKNAGKRNFEVFFDKLIYNKFHEHAERISAAWFCTRFFKEASSFMKRFGWVEGGIERLVDGFEKRIKENGGKIETGVRIVSVSSEGSIVYLKKGRRKRVRADKVISTIPPPELLKVARGLKGETIDELERISYLSCVCMCAGLKKDLDACYWNNVLDKDMPFSVIFKHSSLYEDSCPPGKSVFFILTYLKDDEMLWSMSDEEIKKLYLEHVDKIIPEFSRNVEWTRIYRQRYAEAIYSLNFRNPPIKDGNIYFAGIYRIYPKIRNMASAIESGIEAAKKLLTDAGM